MITHEITVSDCKLLILSTIRGLVRESKDVKSEVENFFASNPAPSAARTIQQCLERIKLNATLLDNNRGEIGEWLSR